VGRPQHPSKLIPEKLVGEFNASHPKLQIPWELSEAVAVDGASMIRTLLFVLRPRVIPGIATTVLYAAA
jgi:ABC-type glycerol-3-phosphate transport system permease component